MRIEQLINDLRQAKVRIKGAVSSVVYEEGRNILADLQRRSPVRTGYYKSCWRMSKKRQAATNNLVSLTFSNNAPYAFWMEYGGIPGGPPWHYPSSKNAQSKTLVVADGRVWAGGLNPGHHLTVGGATEPALLNNDARQRSIAERIGNSVTGVF